MLTGKQRAFLRKLGHELQPVMQIGKDGLTDTVVAAIGEVLEKRELVKISILETAMLDTRKTCDSAAEKLHAEPVQAIGNRFVLYRRSGTEKNRKIERPKR